MHFLHLPIKTETLNKKQKHIKAKPLKMKEAKQKLYFLKYFICLMLLVTYGGATMANNESAPIRGKITDAQTGQPLYGATIKISGTHLGTTTNAHGEFSFKNTGEKAVSIEISYVGYATRQVNIENTGSFIELSLEPQALLSEVVVTGTKTNRRIMDVPTRMELITPAQIEASPAQSADDYLKSVSGIAISRPAGIYSSKTIVSLRGMGGEQGRTLVLKDGIPYNKTDGGSVNWNFFNPDNVDRVEVLKGAGSSIYGGNAMGGVINFFSKKPAKPLQGSVSQSYGTFNTLQTKADLKGRNGSFFWGLDGIYRKGDGYITATVDDFDSLYSIPSFVDEYLVNANIGYFINPNHSIEIGGGYSDDKRGTGTSYFKDYEIAAPEGAFNSHNTLAMHAIYKGVLNNGNQINVSAYNRKEDYVNIRESLKGSNLERYDVTSVREDMGIFGTYSHKLGAHNIIAGLDVKNGAVDGADKYITSSDEVINRGAMLNMGLFIQDEFAIGKTGLSILASLRYDNAKFSDGEFLVLNPTNTTSFLEDFAGPIEDASWNAFSPKLSFQYLQEGSFRVFAAFSRGFRPPVLEDMCRTGRISGGMKIANPNLNPEFIDNFELGADLMLIKNLQLAASGFYAIGSDYLHYISTGDSIRLNNKWRPIKRMENIGKVEIKGFEIDAKYRIGQAFDINAAYTFASATVKEFVVNDPETDDDLTGYKLSYNPENVFHSGITWRNKFVNVFAGINYKDKQYTDDLNTEEDALKAFYTVDMKVWRTFFNYLEVAVQVHNLTDNNYIDSNSIIAPGRMIVGELKFKF